MNNRTATNLAVLAALCGGPVNLIGCANAASSDLLLRQSPVRDPNVLTLADLRGSGAATAYDAVERTRPMFLLSKVDLGPVAQREVYLNGMRLGGVAELRTIPVSEVNEIRFVRAIAGGGSGSGGAGAILVITKKGR